MDRQAIKRSLSAERPPIIRSHNTTVQNMKGAGYQRPSWLSALESDGPSPSLWLVALLVPKDH